MITPEELISYAINYIDIVGQYAEVDSFHLWLLDLSIT